MKALYKFVTLFYRCLFIGVICILFASCKKDEVRAVLNTNAAPPALTTSATSVVLDSTKKSDTAIRFSWNAINFGYQITPTYTLEIDSANGNFSNPTTVTVGSNLSYGYTVADLNTLAQNLGLTPGTAGQLQARIRATVNQNTGAPSNVPPVYSDVVTLTVTPYSTEPALAYTLPDNLYIVGDATPGGWDNPVPVPAQQFTKNDKYGFTITLPLTGGAHYLFLPVNGDWSVKYGVADKSNPAFKKGGAFIPGGQDIPAPDASGTYKITVDFVSGTYTVTKM